MTEHRGAAEPGSVRPSSEPPPLERRPKRRRRALLPAVCCFDSGKSKLDCTIGDISETGLRIRFNKGSNFPTRLQLINVKDRTVQDANVVWRTATQAGLAIEKTHRLADMMTPEFSYLGRYWVERVAR